MRSCKFLAVSAGAVLALSVSPAMAATQWWLVEEGTLVETSGTLSDQLHIATFDMFFDDDFTTASGTPPKYEFPSGPSVDNFLIMEYGSTVDGQTTDTLFARADDNFTIPSGVLPAFASSLEGETKDILTVDFAVQMPDSGRIFSVQANVAYGIGPFGAAGPSALPDESKVELIIGRVFELQLDSSGNFDLDNPIGDGWINLGASYPIGSISEVPVPPALPMLGAALLGLSWMRRRS